MSNRIQERVGRLREELEGKYPLPEPFDSWAYLVTEVAEVGDQLLRLRHPTHVRGTPQPQGERLNKLREEMGDAQFMLATLANQLEIDLLQEVKIACLKIEARVRNKNE